MNSVLLFILGMAVTSMCAWIGIRYLATLGWMDHPGPRKEHSIPVPRTGGIALWFAICVGQIGGWLQLPIAPREWICLHGLAILGLVDDRISLSAPVKAWVGLGLAFTLAIPLSLSYASTQPEIVLMGFQVPTNPPVYTMILATLWFWVLPQSFNLIDGMNGLASGFALIILLAFRMGMRSGHGSYLLGALLAVFLLNWPRSRHFLGDTGAYFLGGLLGLLAFKTKAYAYPSHALWIFAYPILDTTLVVLTRLLLHRPLGKGDRNHFHHHWSRILGGQARWTVPILWIQGAALATRPLYFPGSAYLAWGTLVLMICQGLLFLWLAWRQRDSLGQTQ